MLKALQRHNSQRKLNEPPNGTFSRQQRPKSMRIPNSSFGTLNTSFSNKYTSCQNLNQNSFAEQCVIYEDETENENRPIKNKFIKRYNSLTNLLMSSFRKAKGKKKQIQETESHLAEDSPDTLRKLPEQMIKHHKSRSSMTPGRAKSSISTSSNSGRIILINQIFYINSKNYEICFSFLN